jgi:hypothetical protein
MAPIFVISLYDILCELLEPHGARGATLSRKPKYYKRGPFDGKL